jgi:hypothetical protein
MTASETTSTSIAEPVSYPVPGWRRPTWATDVRYDGNYVAFDHKANACPVLLAGPDDHEDESPISLTRHDHYVINGEDGTITIIEGLTMIYMDVEELPVSQARVLAAALLELAEFAEAQPTP